MALHVFSFYEDDDLLSDNSFDDPNNENSVYSNDSFSEKQSDDDCNNNNNLEDVSKKDNSSDTEPDADTEILESDEDIVVPQNVAQWKQIDSSYKSRKNVPSNRPSLIVANLNQNSTELHIFLNLFPRSLFMFIADCTNKRLNILEKEKRKTLTRTDSYEVMTAIGITLVMSYNRLPALSNYWSNNQSLGNEMIRTTMSMDRFLLLSSKLYFNDPQKPDDASKIYYLEEVVSCMKHTFQRARTDSPFQSIDETMTKFKGRSSLKQYLPMKPVKRGIKLWQRCDSQTGYIYDFNIYAGKETSQQKGTLGERVVRKLCNTIREEDVALCFDRFFTSVELINSLEFACVGTCVRTRKNLPNFHRKLPRGESELYCSDRGSICVRWQDTKDVILLSNCHDEKIVEINRKGKDGRQKIVSCPEAVAFYNKYMGGVDLADQFSSLYDYNRKSTKWWRRVFFKLLMQAVVNAWIIFKELKHRDTPFLSFLVTLAEYLIYTGREHTNIKRRRTIRKPSKRVRLMKNVGDHLPLSCSTRRRCQNCSRKKKEKRTKTMCSTCNIALCINCFTDYHTK